MNVAITTNHTNEFQDTIFELFQNKYGFDIIKTVDYFSWNPEKNKTRIRELNINRERYTILNKIYV